MGTSTLRAKAIREHYDQLQTARFWRTPVIMPQHTADRPREARYNIQGWCRSHAALALARAAQARAVYANAERMEGWAA